MNTLEQISKAPSRVSIATTPVSKCPRKPEGGEKDKEAAKEAAKKEAKKKLLNDMPRFRQNESFIETVKDTYEIEVELGAGSFGAVYMVIRHSDKSQLAMKCESVHAKRTMLTHEASVLLALSLMKSPHFLDLEDCGIIPNRFQFVIMTMVGKNLWDIRCSLPEKKYSLGTTLKIAEQTLAGIRDLHRVGYLHRDLKPPNFAAGRSEIGNLHTIYVLDLGMARRIATKGKDGRTPRKDCAFRGTTRYAPLTAHDFKEQSRKDDIESWWYMVTELMIVDVPWKQFKGTERDEVAKVKRRLREEVDFFKLTFRKSGCYNQMSAILLYLDKLEYSSIPDYDFVFQHIRNASIVNGISEKSPLDWDPTKEYTGPAYKMGQSYICKALE